MKRSKIYYSLTLSIIFSLIIISCDSPSTSEDFLHDSNQRNDQEVRLSENKLDSTQFYKLFDKIFSEYNDLKQVTLFSPKNKNHHNLQIILQDTTIIKEVDDELNITNHQKMKSSSSTCKSMQVGTAYNNSGYPYANITVTVCDDDSSGYVNAAVSSGSADIYSVSYQAGTVEFSNVTFNSEWKNYTTHWYYINNYEGESATSYNPNTQTTINGKGSHNVFLQSLRVNRTEEEQLYPPTTPTLSYPSDGGKTTPTGNLYWNESDGNPTPDYYLDLDCGSFNNTYTTSDTRFTIPSSLNLETGQNCSWRVRAKNSEGYSNFSQVWSFETVPGVSISGTTTIPKDGYGSWTASVSHGPSPYEYEWEHRLNPVNGGWTSWQPKSGDETSYFTWSSSYEVMDLRVTVTDANGATSKTSTIHRVYFE